MLRKEIRIDPGDIIVGQYVRVSVHEDDMIRSKEGRVTRITEDSLFKYLWVGTFVIGVVPKTGDRPALLEQEFFTPQDVRDEELNAVYMALGAAIRKQFDFSDVARDFVQELEARGYEVRPIRRVPSIIPTPKVEVESKRPAA